MGQKNEKIEFQTLNEKTIDFFEHRNTVNS